jgi:hypothetical protein
VAALMYSSRRGTSSSEQPLTQTPPGHRPNGPVGDVSVPMPTRYTVKAVLRLVAPGAERHAES